MVRCETPDHLIGIGGGGSRVVYRYMSQRWLLDEVLAKDENGTADELHATVIDTAFADTIHKSSGQDDEEQKDTPRQIAKATISEALDESDFRRRDGVLNLNLNMVTEQIPDDWIGKFIINQPAVQSLCDDQSLNSWWLESGREPLSKVQENGFTGGVWRRRSMSKMLYHAAEHTGNSVAPQTSDNDEVCIVATLGGGTGSGMAMELAHSIDSDHTHLFGIIPHDEDGENEKMNAHAALSELEYATLTGESPFDTIVLIPHIKHVANRDEDFEMAMVRTLVAHQNAMIGENLLTSLRPDSQGNNPPKFTPFSLAVPHTVLFNIDARDRAEEAIDKVLDERQKWLGREDDFYSVLRKFLKSEFPAARAALTGQMDDRGETSVGTGEAQYLKGRLENKLVDRFLTQDAFSIANLGGLTDRIRNEFKEVLDDDNLMNVAPDAGDLERTLSVVNRVPSLMTGKLTDLTSYDDRGVYDRNNPRANRLVETIRAEVENVSTRRDAYKALSVISGDSKGLNSDDAEIIRRALRDVALDTKRTQARRSIQKPSLEEYINERRREARRHNDRHRDLIEFHRTVASNLLRSLNDARVEIESDAETLALIKKYEDRITELTDSVKSEVKEKLDDVEGAETVAGVQQHSLNLDDLKELNEKLSEIGLSEIEGDQIRTEFSDFQNLKQLSLEHDPSPFPRLGTDNSVQYNQLYARADFRWITPHENEPDPAIDHPFEPVLNASNLEREKEIEDKKENLVKQISNKILDSLCNDDEDLESFSTRNLQVPRGLSRQTLRGTLENAMENSDAESASELLDSLMSTDAIDPSDATETPEPAGGGDSIPPVSSALRDAYLSPITTQASEEFDELRRLAFGHTRFVETLSSEDGDRDRLAPLFGDQVNNGDGVNGTLLRLEMVQKLCGRAQDVSDDDPAVELLTADEMSTRRETYGADFVVRYNEVYEIELDSEYAQSADDDHPYAVKEETESEDLIDGPEHIGDSMVWENRRELILQNFRASVRSMRNNDHGRVPINTPEPEGSSESEITTPAYDGMRVVPVYFSRAFKNRHAHTGQPLYDTVNDELTDFIEPKTSNVYKHHQYDVGGPDEISMVTFIGGLFLDNINLMTKTGGYMDTYKKKAKRHEFVGAQHSIGLGGSERWGTMRDWTKGEPGDEAFGTYVYREDFGRIGGDHTEFMTRVLEAQAQDDEDANKVFLNMITADRYDSTIDLDK